MNTNHVIATVCIIRVQIAKFQCFNIGKIVFTILSFDNSTNIMEHSPIRLNLILARRTKFITTARKSMFNLVKWPSLVAECLKLPKI